MCWGQPRKRDSKLPCAVPAKLPPPSPKHSAHTASGLLKWVLAMVNYFGVAKGVEPKRKKVRQRGNLRGFKGLPKNGTAKRAAAVFAPPQFGPSPHPPPLKPHTLIHRTGC